MTKLGRPHGTSREGTHRHPGAMRWHLLEQSHHNRLHERFGNQVEVILTKHQDKENHLHAPDFEEDEDHRAMLKAIEEGLNLALALETIDEIIKDLLPKDKEEDATLQWGTDGPPYGDKSEPFGEPDAEEREPNTIGLP